VLGVEHEYEAVTVLREGEERRVFHGVFHDPVARWFHIGVLTQRRVTLFQLLHQGFRLRGDAGRKRAEKMVTFVRNALGLGEPIARLRSVVRLAGTPVEYPRPPRYPGSARRSVRLGAGLLLGVSDTERLVEDGSNWISQRHQSS